MEKKLLLLQTGQEHLKFILWTQKRERKKTIKRITFGRFYNDQPAWSPKGDKIAYSSLIEDSSQIVIKDLKSGEVVQLTKKGSSYESPTWSPNGWFLAFATTGLDESAIYIMQTDRPGIRRLTFLKGGGFFPAWSPVLN
jgi:TolB protein